VSLRGRCALLLAPAALAAAQPAQADERDWGLASDLAVGTLVAWSVAVPLAQGDENGALQAGISIASAQGVSQLLKHLVDAERPDGSNRRSFPSAHSATALAAASSIYRRRGPGEGVPALALAGFTGLSRVEARKHHWRDVLAGAAIGGVSGVLFTDRHPDRRATIAVWGDTGGGGMSFAMTF
jgi:membrane-associated phospholipid phosphatase